MINFNKGLFLVDSSKIKRILNWLSISFICQNLIVVGDIHGDLRKAISSLEAARVLQEVGGQVRWAGGDTVVVQLGDVLDRGDSEIGQMF